MLETDISDNEIPRFSEALTFVDEYQEMFESHLLY